jgi:hypothetical protein
MLKELKCCKVEFIIIIRFNNVYGSVIGYDFLHKIWRKFVLTANVDHNWFYKHLLEIKCHVLFSTFLLYMNKKWVFIINSYEKS